MSQVEFENPVPKESVKTTEPLDGVMYLWCAIISLLSPFMWIPGSHTSINCAHGAEMYVMSIAWINSVSPSISKKGKAPPQASVALGIGISNQRALEVSTPVSPYEGFVVP